MVHPAHWLALRLARGVGVPFARLYFRLRIEGRGHVPRKGPAILAANHASFLDPVLLHAVTPRPIFYLMDAAIYRQPHLHWFCRLFEAIPLEGGAKAAASLARAGRYLEGGHLVGIFPEGGISRDGRLQPFRPGAAALALRHGVPLVPVRILGTDQALPRDRRLPRPRPVVVRAGPPLPVPRYGPDPAPRVEVERWTQRLFDAVAALGPATSDAQPPGAAPGREARPPTDAA